MTAQPPGTQAPPEPVGGPPLRAALVLSGVRCVTTYVLAPALSSIAVVATLAGAVAVWLHVLAIGCVSYGTARMWRARRPWRVPYTALAAFVVLLSLAGVLDTLA